MIKKRIFLKNFQSLNKIPWKFPYFFKYKKIPWELLLLILKHLMQNYIFARPIYNAEKYLF